MPLVCRSRNTQAQLHTIPLGMAGSMYKVAVGTLRDMLGVSRQGMEDLIKALHCML